MRTKPYRSHAAVFLLALPLKAWLQRFSLVCFLMIACVMAGFSMIDQERSSHIRMRILDGFMPILRVIERPVHSVMVLQTRLKYLWQTHLRNEQLHRENIHLRQQLFTYQKAASEHEELQLLLNMVALQEKQYLSAKIVADTTTPVTRSILINVGKTHGVQLGQAVIHNEGLVGRVVEVGQYNARILLITDINSHIPVIFMDSRERAIVDGNNAPYLTVSHITKGVVPQLGEMVITSGEGKMFPEGVAVGRVNQVSQDSLTIAPLVPWNRLNHVTVIK